MNNRYINTYIIETGDGNRSGSIKKKTKSSKKQERQGLQIGARRYSHLTLKDRKMIEKMNLGGCNHSEIGRAVGRSPGTIQRELRRCEPGEYTAEQAQKDVEAKKKNKREYWQQQKELSRKQASRKRLTPTEKKQIEICIRMQPSIDQDTVVKITGIDKEILSDSFERIREQVIAM